MCTFAVLCSVAFSFCPGPHAFSLGAPDWRQSGEKPQQGLEPQQGEMLGGTSTSTNCCCCKWALCRPVSQQKVTLVLAGQFFHSL